MCIFACKKHKKVGSVEVLPLEKIAEIMYNKSLSFTDEVVDVVYSPDKTRRYVILMSASNHCYSFVYQQLRVFDEDELRLMSTNSSRDKERAYWAQANSGLSLYSSREDALRGIKFEVEYKQYFEM